MTDEEKYTKFINIVCEMLGLNKPIDILKLCQITSDFIRPFEIKIKDLEQVNEQLKSQIEKMKCCANCKHANEGEYDCFENCSSCTVMYCICQKTKKEMDWTDKCDEWEFAE